MRRTTISGSFYRRTPASNVKNYYKLLGISPDERDPLVIKHAYRKAALLCHPDKHPNIDPAQFHLLQQAYETLKDPALRQSYDASMEELNTSFDDSITPDQALVQLRQFFELLFVKRGLAGNIDHFSLHKRQHTRDELRDLVERLNSGPHFEAVQAWHYLELNLIDTPNPEFSCSSTPFLLNKLLTQGSTEVPSSFIEEQYGFSFTLREAHYHSKLKTGHVKIDIFLHDAKKLQALMSELQEEDPLQLLEASLKSKLDENPDQQAAKAIAEILLVIQTLEEKPEFITALCFNLNCVLNYPSDKNFYHLEQYFNLIQTKEPLFWNKISSFGKDLVAVLKTQLIADPLEKEIFFKFRTAIREHLESNPQDQRALAAKHFLLRWDEIVQAGLSLDEVGIHLGAAYQAFINPTLENLAELKRQLDSLKDHSKLYKALGIFIGLSAVAAITAGIICAIPLLFGIGMAVFVLTLFIACFMIPSKEDRAYMKKEKAFDSSAYAFFKKISANPAQLPAQTVDAEASETLEANTVLSLEL